MPKKRKKLKKHQITPYAHKELNKTLRDLDADLRKLLNDLRELGKKIKGLKDDVHVLNSGTG